MLKSRKSLYALEKFLKMLQIGIALFLIAIFGSLNCAAQTSLSKPIRVLVGSPAGGGGDAIARLVTQAITATGGGSFVIENKSGAAGNIAADYVAKSLPDGQTLLLAYTGHVINPGLFKKLPFDAANDFVPVIRLVRNQTLLVVKPENKARNLVDLLNQSKQRPGQITLAAMIGTSQHLAGELLQTMADVDFQTIPYRGNPAAINDVLGGQIDAVFSTVTVAGPFVRSGKLRALAIAGSSRSPLFPEVPTIAESGVPSFSSEGWYGILAPAGTPKHVVEALYVSFAKALEQPSVKQALSVAGNEPALMNPTEFDRFIRTEIPRLGEVIRKAKIEKE